MTEKLGIGVLVSGRGSNLDAIVEATAEPDFPAAIRLVVSNRPTAPAVERSRSRGLAVEVVDHKGFPDRDAFDARLVELLRGRSVGLVCLAGFDRILSGTFVRAFPNRILNIHPALLPAFPGLHAQRQALEYGVKVTGCTVHFVDEKMDHGPIVLQATVPVLDDDTDETLAARILAEEHRIFPEAIRLFAEGRLRIDDRHVHIN